MGFVDTQPQGGGDGLVPVTVVIPIKHSQATIRTTVEALLGQDYAGEFEVLVVGPTGDPTWAELAPEIAAGTITAIEVDLTPDRDTPAAKRNIGLARARGDVLALCDSDMVPPVDWLSRAVELLGDGWDAVAGPMQSITMDFWGTYVDENRLGSKTPRMGREYVLNAETFGKPGFKPAVTANVAVKRRVYEDVGGFDEAFVYAYEDYEWCKRIADHGYTMLCTPVLAGRHHHRQGLRALTREYVRSGRGCADYARAHPHCRFTRRRRRHVAAVYGAALAVPLTGLLVGLSALGLGLAAAVAALGLISVARVRRPVAIGFPFATMILGGAFVAGLTVGTLGRRPEFVPAPARRRSPGLSGGGLLRGPAFSMVSGPAFETTLGSVATAERPPRPARRSWDAEPDAPEPAPGRGVPWTLLLLLGVLGLAAFLRFWQLGVRPGLEVDEPVYGQIAASIAATGRLLVKPEVGVANPDYLYHPPFYFWLLGGWFSVVGSSLAKARTFAAGMSLVTLLMVFGLSRRFIGRAALLPVLLIATDGWLVYSNRISWMENTLMVLGVGAMWLYASATQTRRTSAYALAGVALGMAVVFKHVAGYLVLAVLINWLLSRRDRDGHLAMVGAGLAVVAAYLLAMTVAFGHVYWDDTAVQFNRTIGIGDTRGTVSTAGQALGAIFGQYSVFYATLAVSLLGGLLVLGRLFEAIRHRSLAAIRRRGVLFSWAMAALIFFGAIHLHFSNYFLMILIPLYVYVSVEIVDFVRQRRSLVPAAYAVLAVVLAANMATFVQRIADRNDNALVAVSRFAAAHIPRHALVVTEEWVANMIHQPYCHTWRAAYCESRTSYVITYTSRTERPPPVPALRRLIKRSDRLAMFTGFKERITVYHVVRPPWSV